MSHPETQPEQLTPRDFARRLGYKPHYGNQLAKDGRLVFAPDGKHVLLAESLARFEATKDPSRQGVADRHAAARGTRAQAGAPAPAIPATSAAPASEEGEDGGEGDDEGAKPALYDFHNAKAKREHWAAEREHAAYRKEAGELIELATHIAALADLGATVRAKLEAWATVLPPQLVGRDEAGARAVIADQVELLLRDLEAAARRHAGQDAAT